MGRHHGYGHGLDGEEGADFMEDEGRDEEVTLVALLEEPGDRFVVEGVLAAVWQGVIGGFDDLECVGGVG